MTAVTVHRPEVRSADDLLALLPQDVRDRVDSELLEYLPDVLALRVLVTIKDSGWHEHVLEMTINYPSLLKWARTFPARDSIRVRAEIAASLGNFNVPVNLWMAARVLDPTNFAAVLDALRIAHGGFAS